MIDRWALALLRPGLEAGARGLVRAGVGADAVTWAGFVIGLAAAGCIAWQAFEAGMVLLLLSRLLDVNPNRRLLLEAAELELRQIVQRAVLLARSNGGGSVAGEEGPRARVVVVEGESAAGGGGSSSSSN
jgi:hypothetical protein